MMVTILKGEQGAFIALSSHSGPPLIYSNLRRPGSSHSGPPLIYFDLGRPGQRDGWIHTHAERQTEGETLLYDIRYSRLYDIMGWVHRVVGTIWNVGAGDLGSLPVRNANSGNPLRFILSLARRQQC